MIDDDKSINIGRDVLNSSFFQGDIISSELNSDQHITNSTIANSTAITIDNKYLEQMPIECADSLQKVKKLLNNQIILENVPPQTIIPVNESLNKLAEETAKVKSNNDNDDNIKKKILEKIKLFAKSLVRLSPKIAKTLIASASLTPFDSLIGETTENILESAIKLIE